MGWVRMAALVGSLVAVLQGQPAVSATVETVDVGTQTGTFTGSARGFWFTAPVDFWITGLDVPTDASTGNIFAGIVRLNAAPPFYSNETTDYDVLAEVRDQTTGVTNLDIEVSAGDMIGVLGYRGGVNSYGTGPYSSSILGNAVILNRFGTQNSLVANSLAGLPVWQESGGSISRLFLTVTDTDPSPASVVPLPASVPLLLAGIGVLAVLRRRRAA